MPKKRRWLKVLIGLVIFVIVIVAAFYLMPSILTAIDPHDDPLSDDSQVRLQAVSVPNEDNGFFDLSAVTDEMIFEPRGGFLLDYADYKNPVEWNQQEVDETLAQSAVALALFDLAVAKSHFQIPDYADPENISLETKIYPMSNWRIIARVQAIKALSLSRANRPDEALREAVKINKLGHQIIVGHNSMIGTLVGISIQQLGSETILRILPFGTPSTEVLAEVRNTLKNSSDNVEGYRDAFRGEYTNIANTIQESINQELDENIQYLVDEGEVSRSYADFVKYGYYYKPNQTQNLYINLHKQEIEAIGTKCDLDELGQELQSNIGEISSGKIVFTENAIGKMLYSLTGLALSSVLEKGCENDLIARVAEIQLALREYKSEHNILLNDYQPLFSTSPLDPFDHQPIRYNANKRILYSVGPNKKDVGGSTGDDWTQMENPTFEIKF